ncbi:unnamed protein product [Caenorhabditis angaria]|uniref:Globin domain-containing protein n=1 Tax=Caenorhabditis angaria TaxID=860376 RepID=A0A9P1IRI9_9PELO|nr:unnamed protein product [Caenorhabditis angaria]
MKLNCFGKTPERDLCELRDEEMEAIKEVWVRAKEREIGKHILQELIERKPQFKDYFGIQADEKDVFSCREFQLQAHRIQNFLDTAVSSLGFCPMKNVLQMAYRIGQIHFYRGVNFGADNWLTFKKVTVEIVTQENSKTENGEDESIKDTATTISLFPANQSCLVVIGWEKFMGSVIKEMKKGFLDEARRNCHDEETRF